MKKWAKELYKKCSKYLGLNHYTYENKISFDGYNHLKDIALWVKYGSGPTDPTSYVLRKEIGDLKLGNYIAQNYDKLKKLASKQGGRLSLKHIEEMMGNW